MRSTPWDRFFYATPGCWYGTPPAAAPGSTGHIVVDPARAVDAVAYIQRRARRLGVSIGPGLRVLADGGLLVTLTARGRTHAPSPEATPRPQGLAAHVLAMADDAYLTGHPEWAALVDEARAMGPA